MIVSFILSHCLSLTVCTLSLLLHDMQIKQTLFSSPSQICALQLQLITIIIYVLVRYRDCNLQQGSYCLSYCATMEKYFT